MKRNIIFMLLLAMMSMKLTAQVNPQKGYVITNENDTIYGTIDYLTDEPGDSGLELFKTEDDVIFE